MRAKDRQKPVSGEVQRGRAERTIRLGSHVSYARPRRFKSGEGMDILITIVSGMISLMLMLLKFSFRLIMMIFTAMIRLISK
jgi:hypothetical protein